MIKYYTDVHDVDEDRVTISVHGGDWEDRVWTGVTCRNMPGDGSVTHDNIASSNMKNSAFIRIITMSTKIRGLSWIKVDIGVSISR